MPTIVIAKTGDCLCGIAIDHGFFDCQPLRALAENAAVLNRELIAGDQITVPDLAIEDYPRSIDSKHTFKVKSSPPVNVRFVHGSPTLPYRDDAETTTLHISNFITNKGGVDGLRDLPTDYGYHDDGHADPDSFKVEVWDPAAGASVNVKLEALKPLYTADPNIGALNVTGWTEWNDPQRLIDPLVCNVVSAGTGNTYRSKYMRLVVDEEDIATPGVPGQLLFVSDIADGRGAGAPGDNDSIEILDQLVRATYVVERCAGVPKCKVSKVLEIGGGERRRLRMHFYLVRETPGIDTFPGGIPIDTVKQHVGFRTWKYFRRIYAQAAIAPKITGITVLDPPARNMLCLSHLQGNAAAGGVSFTMDIETEAGVPFPFQPLPLQAGESPVDLGHRIAASLPPGLSAQVFPTPLQRTAPFPACDVLITADNGDRIKIKNAAIPLAGQITVEVPNVNLMSVLSGDAVEDASPSLLTIETKRLLHLAPITDDVLHCIVIGDFLSPALLGQAYSPSEDFPAAFQPPLPYRSALIVSYTHGGAGVLDDSDTNPSLLAHETAHVLSNLSHTQANTAHFESQLLCKVPPLYIPFDGSKRLCDGPFLVTMEKTGFPSTHVQVRLAETIRTVGAPKMEGW